MKLYVVILEDRHIDVRVEVFSDKGKAITRCWSLAQQNSRGNDVEGVKVDDDNCILCLRYSCEGDSCRVVETELVE